MVDFFFFYFIHIHTYIFVSIVRDILHARVYSIEYDIIGVVMCFQIFAFEYRQARIF